MPLSLCQIINLGTQSFEFKVITSIESIVPMGLGRSRIISSDEVQDYKNFTSTRSLENKKQNKSKRANVKIIIFY